MFLAFQFFLYKKVHKKKVGMDVGEKLPCPAE